MKKFFFGLILGLVLATTFSVTAGTNEIKLIVNGQTIEMDVAPVQINGRVMVPARFVAEPLGASVQWDVLNNAVVISNSSKLADTTSTEKPSTEFISGQELSSKYNAKISLKSQNNAIIFTINDLLVEIPSIEYSILTSGQPISVPIQKNDLDIDSVIIKLENYKYFFSKNILAYL